MEVPAQVKVCTKCEQYLPINNFCKDKGNKCGYNYYCKKCVKDYQVTNRDKLLVGKKEYYQKNKLKIREKTSKYYIDHKKHLLELSADNREKHKNNPEFTEIPQLWYFKRIRKNSNLRKDCVFNITYQQLIEFSKCMECCFCGTKLLFTKTVEQSAGNQNASLDRIDSSKGYETGNIQWLCWRCNNHKKDASDSDFIKMCQEVTARQQTLDKYDP